MIELRGLHLGNIARSPAESVRPDLWPDHAWVPALGPQGGILYDVAGGRRHGLVYLNAGAAPAVPYTMEPSGYMIKCDGSYSVRNSDISITSFPFHIAMIGKATTGQTQCMCGIGTLSSVSSAAFLAVTSGNIRQNITARTATDSYGDAVGSGVFSAVGAYHSSVSRKLFLDGRLVAESTADKGVSAPYDNLRIGSLPRAAETYFAGQTGYFGLYLQQMSNDQLAQISADPLLPFRRRVPAYYSVPSGGGASLAASSAWRVFTASAIDTDWAIRAALNGAAAWAVLTQSGAATGWRITTASDADTAWDLRAAAASPSAWRILTASEVDTAWSIAADLSASTAWAILTSMDAATAWAIISAGTLLASTGWAIRTGADTDTGWRLKTDAAADTAWAVRNANDAATAWDIQAALAGATAWRILTDLQADTAWTVITDMDADAAWNILRADPTGTAWRVCTDLDTPTAWAVFSDIIPEPVRVFLAPGRQFMINAASRVLIITKTRP